jgi:hypothetical protein
MRKLSLFAVLVILCLATTAFADNIVFDLSPAGWFTNRVAGSGVGQGVSVDTTQTINDMQFYLNLPDGGDLKFMIWNSTNDSLLYLNEVKGIAASQNPSWISSPDFNFTLQAGNTYFFGVISDSNALIGYIFPPIDYSNNGLTAVKTGNTNYDGYDIPTYSGNGTAEIALRLGTVPEPGSMVLLGTGALGLAGVLRRKLML